MNKLESQNQILVLLKELDNSLSSTDRKQIKKEIFDIKRQLGHYDKTKRVSTRAMSGINIVEVE